MNISIEKLVEIIVREVVTALLKQGVEINFDSHEKDPLNLKLSKRQTIDMSNYKTPVLTENHLLSLEPEVTDIEIPEETILTPGAKDIIKKRKLIINNNKKSEDKCRG